MNLLLHLGPFANRGARPAAWHTTSKAFITSSMWPLITPKAIRSIVSSGTRMAWKDVITRRSVGPLQR